MATNELPKDAGVCDGWQALPLRPCDEAIIPIGNGTYYNDLVTSGVYAGEHLHSPYRDDNVIDSASPVIYVRQSVAEKLRYAQSLLPEGLKLIIFDGYRSVEVQRALFDQFLDALRVLRPEYTEEQLVEETEHYVALPSADTAQPSPHSTGGAVDVAIIRDNSMIEFGTPFDHGSVRSALRFFEEESHVLTYVDREAKEHRRLLYRVMTAGGFEGYEYEWWHFNAHETQMGARAAGLSEASFGAATITTSSFYESEKVFSDGNQPSAPIDRIAPTQ